MCGGSKSVDVNTVSKWKATCLRELMSQYAPKVSSMWLKQAFLFNLPLSAQWHSKETTVIVGSREMCIRDRWKTWSSTGRLLGEEDTERRE